MKTVAYMTTVAALAFALFNFVQPAAPSPALWIAQTSAPYSAVFYIWNGSAAATGFRSLEQFATRAKCVEYVTPIARQLFPLLQANGARANAFCATEADLRSSNFGPAIQ